MKVLVLNELYRDLSQSGDTVDIQAFGAVLSVLNGHPVSVALRGLNAQLKAYQDKELAYANGGATSSREHYLSYCHTVKRIAQCKHLVATIEYASK
ncbi:hypothetical protein [Ktedonobacter robiniae]|uniref:Uncharacterized protein n=1 Tax=Ktedonobacter robiniae TaxID=2778365 RepID=A0ABQ3US14_9CHLR|nr:hypothetical protein [Ktedonobacter robiniae]GHO55509.1 hypothetical protein KSB_39840 [Ktedonobacter robiniae]